jgi:hypothetical protein
MLPETVIIDHLLPHLPFKEAISLNDNRLTEEDIITHCAKSNAEDIVNYIFRDLDKNDHIITNEVRLENLRILLNSEEVQEQIYEDNSVAVVNRQLMTIRSTDPNLTRDLVPHRLLDALQVGVDRIAKSGKIDLLRMLLESYPDQLSQVTIPHEAIFVAAARNDSSAVDLILDKVKGNLPLRVWSDMSQFDDFIFFALKGCISGGQFEMFAQIINVSNPNGRTVMRC